MEKSNSPEKTGRHLLRIIRPLFWWLLLVVVLYGIRTHQRLMEATRLNFTVSMQGQAIDAAAVLDGIPAISGQNISLGHHTFVVTNPKGETFTTNLFIWYGKHDLGTIDLKRTMGVLAVAADPPAPLLSVSGPEWSVTLTNSAGFTNSVPTDQYAVQSQYAHWGRSDDVSVAAGSTATWRITPQLGAMQLSCNEADATFQLFTTDGRQVEAGSFPSFITELPEGDYKLVSVHHRHRFPQTVSITTGATNDHPVEFLYGKAVLETEPPAATVLGDGGREYGVTPFTFDELSPGILKVVLHRAGYESVPVTLEIVANQTATFQTNLVSAGYGEAMKAGKQFMEQTDYDRASQSFEDALVAKPDDADALTLQHEASGLGHLQQAKTLGSKGDYVGGDRELAVALQSLPDNEEIKSLMAEYKQHEPEQIEREQQERLARPKKIFDELAAKIRDAQLFESHELKSAKPVQDVVAAIVSSLEQVQPPFKITDNISPQPETFAIYATQKDTSIITTTGYRKCLIVCGQASDAETQIYFENVEYKAKHNVSLQGMALRDNETFVPLAPSRIPDMTDKMRGQIEIGVSNLTARIQGAIGQTPMAQPAATQ